MIKDIRLLYLYFENEISPDEIVKVRGAVNAALAERHSVLFHNHMGDGFRYAYPLIQYKRVDRRAAIVCVEDGTEAMVDFFDAEVTSLNIGGKATAYQLRQVKAVSHQLGFAHEMMAYRLTNWLPFNAANYNAFQCMEGIVEKTAFLERMLTGNILSFLKGIGLFVDDRVECRLTSLSHPRVVNYKGVGLMAFDADFQTNLSLPALIGLGKGVSVGFGTLSSKEKYGK